MRLARLKWCLIGLTAFASTSQATPVLITTPTTIGPSDTMVGGVPLANAEITVRGTTLTVNGRHTIQSLVVENNGVVTHAQGFTHDYSGGAGTDVVNGMFLEVRANPTGGNVTIDPTARIDASNRGLANNAGLGAGASGGWFACCAAGSGAGYGGDGGGSGNSPFAPGGGSHGSLEQPALLGSGGGAAGGAGGFGGGSVRLVVSGTITNLGGILANGQSGPGAEGGGGSGGSIWLEASLFQGTGSISANGGIGNRGYGSGGGGGRIALYWASSTFSGPVTAFGGGGSQKGGAGTAFTKAASHALGDLIVANDGVGARTPLPASNAACRQLTVGGGAEFVVDSPLTIHSAAVTGASSRVTHSQGNTTGLQLAVVGDLFVGEGSSINVSGRGFANNTGPGAGASGGWFACCAAGSGAGYGGAGGSSGNNPLAVGGGAYGSVSHPTYLGSGGGAAGGAGGVGGGRIRLTVGGTLALNGSINSNGQDGVGAEGGGGSGGSVWIDSASITGTGSITANGGIGNRGYGSGGGGGRIALYWAESSFSGPVTTFGGIGYQKGGAGTVWTQAASNPLGDLVVANDGPGARTSLPTETPPFDDLTVGGGAELIIDSPMTVNTGLVTGVLSRISHSEAQMAGLWLSITGDFTIDEGSSIDVSDRGHFNNSGPGAGASGGWFACCAAGSGAGHGGMGGSSGNAPVAPGGAMYGSATSPSLLGSGGGYAGGPGGSGGGRIRLTVGGVLTNAGTIRADGHNGIGAEGGGGSGGSVWIDTASFEGAGAITANGGIGNRGYGSGGGGGRIAVYSCFDTVPAGNFQVFGGAGHTSGQPGSIYFGSSAITITRQPVGGDFRGGDFFQLGLTAASTNGDLTYQWRRRNATGEFIPLVEGERGIFTEVTTNTLFIAGWDCQGAGTYDCLVCDSCGCFPSAQATLGTVPPGDFNGDGGTDGTDVEAFFAAWESGDPAGDINLDGGIDGADVDFFFDFWEQGC